MPLVCPRRDDGRPLCLLSSCNVSQQLQAAASSCKQLQAVEAVEAVPCEGVDAMMNCSGAQFVEPFPETRPSFFRRALEEIF
mmetsp:Transcript_18666/g.40784  ORF Transcript_18666/g.40784 Transcript_18666/m.40784 type:complete len:82 (+) Transcript_18666:158-403(+)